MARSLLGAETIVRKASLEVPPPSVGLKTETGYLPAGTPVGTTTFSIVGLTYIVGIAPLFNRTCEPRTKFEPYSVMVSWGDTAKTLVVAESVQTLTTPQKRSILEKSVIAKKGKWVKNNC